MDEKDTEVIIERTTNPRIIKRILTVPDLWELITEDDSPSPEEYEPIVHDSMYYLLARKGNKVIGLFVVHPLTTTLAIGHVNILPSQWGNRKQNKLIGEKAIQWIWDNTEIDKIVATVPVIYKKVLAYTQRIGMKREGICRKSYKKHGELHDQYYVGVNR